MRTTVVFEPDTAAAVDALRRERGVGVSEAVNELIRRGLLTQVPAEERFEQRTYHLGLKMDVSNVADAIEVLEGPAAR
ncbi:MAG: ribbon-helix-helix protein, CopG family [Trueperaceae bacterium]|nr:ribbon-helix-helix protein, CopG family [Trueperaceae bacterium]